MDIDITDSQIIKALDADNWDMNKHEGLLMLLELLVKANAGFYNSHTEERFLQSFGLLKADRTANKKGRRFISAAVYEGSNRRPKCFDLMSLYRS
jgi:thioredoxin-like negative regulator of GroEL